MKRVNTSRNIFCAAIDADKAENGNLTKRLLDSIDDDLESVANALESVDDALENVDDALESDVDALESDVDALQAIGN